MTLVPLRRFLKLSCLLTNVDGMLNVDVVDEGDVLDLDAMERRKTRVRMDGISSLGLGAGSVVRQLGRQLDRRRSR